MNIGTASDLSGLPAKTIRYYEEIGLVVPGRRDNGYRDYDTADVHRLSFVSRARSLGFSIEECRALLSLYDDHGRSAGDVRALAQRKLAEMAAKIAQLESLRATLTELVTRCAGGDRPDCPILADLAGAVPVRRAD